MQKYIVFDVETPNRASDRMSAIGITVISDGAIEEEFYSLVDPETHFDYFNVQLTGIDEQAVKGAPAFPELWKRIEPIMSGGILVAHNAVFDMGVLKRCLHDYGISWRQSVPYLCTVQMGRKLLPKMSHKLNVLCEYYGIALEHHHAASDSRACAEILLNYISGGADVSSFIRTYTLTGRSVHTEGKRTSPRDIWNPWHGCVKKSEGCENCYMYFLDRLHDKDGSKIYRTKSGFNYPLQKDRQGNYKVKSGEMIRVCMTSDFFLKEADEWRAEAWEIMRRRSDVIFFLLTKRPERVAQCLPDNWGDGWDNIFFNVSAENQRRADERIPIMLELPFRHKGVMCAPLIGSVSMGKYLETGQIEQVLCDGENYDGARPCDFEWVKLLRRECEDNSVSFVFCGTGRRFIKDGRLYNIEGNSMQSRQAHKSGMSFSGKPIHFELYDEQGFPLPDERRHTPFFREKCDTCGMRPICNGCSSCGKCE